MNDQILTNVLQRQAILLRTLTIHVLVQRNQMATTTSEPVRFFAIEKAGEYLQSPYDPQEFGALETAYVWTKESLIEEGIDLDLQPDEQIVEIKRELTVMHIVDPCTLHAE